MYMNEYDARNRFLDLKNVVHFTDKYSVSIFKLVCCNQNYRNALWVGIIIGLSQGIIISFFEDFFCALVDNTTTLMYCKQQVYNPQEGFIYLLFLNAFAVGPTLIFLYYFESNIL